MASLRLMVKWNLYWLWFFAWCHTLQAQMETQNLYSESFGVVDGLNLGVIGDFRTDENDFLWITTLGGLQLFDGLKFTDMNHLVHPGIGVGKFNYIHGHDLFLLKDSILYKITPEQYLSPRAPEYHLPPYPIGGRKCNILFEDSKYLFIDHFNDSLYQIDKQTLSLKRVYALPVRPLNNYYWDDLYIRGDTTTFIQYIDSSRAMCRLDLGTGKLETDRSVFPISRAAIGSGDTLIILHRDRLSIHTRDGNHNIALPDSLQDFAGKYLLLSGRDSVYVALENAIYVFNLRSMSGCQKYCGPEARLCLM